MIKKLLAGLSLLAISFGAVLQTAGQTTVAAESSVLFRNVRIFDGSGSGLSAPSNVLVKGDKIAQISTSAIAAPVGATIVDGKGRTLMPGLSDMHTHLFMAGTPQAALLAQKPDIAKIEATALAEAEKMLMRGFTSIRDLGGAVYNAKTAIDSGKAIGPRIYPSYAMISQTSGHGDFRLPSDRSRRFGGTSGIGELLKVAYIADGRDEVLTATRENLRQGATQIKVMAGGGAASAYDPLDVAQYTLDELKAAVEAADDWGTYVTVHAYTPKAVRRAIQAGVKCIDHGQLMDEETIKLMAENGIWLSLQSLEPAPATAPQTTREKKQTVIDGTDFAFRMAKKYGVKLVFGTDIMFDPAALKGMNTDILKLKQWFTPAEALSIVTKNHGELFALSGPRNPVTGKLGVVEVNAMADLLLVDGDPTVNLDLVGNPDKNFMIIMKDGKIYKNTVK